MKHLWAPWRIEYIRQEPEKGCIFCNRFQRKTDRRDLVLYRGPRVLVMMNRFPYNSGHLLISPVEHTGDLTALPVKTQAALFAMLQECARVLEETMAPEGFNLGMNLGRVAGAGVADHLHFHLVPRWNGDTNFMPALAEVKVVPEHLDQTYLKLKPAFARLGKGPVRRKKTA